MDVYEAVTSRRAVRGFTGRPVPVEVLERVLSAAAWAPSGSNLQPWHVYVLTGGPLAELKKRALERVAAGDPWDEREYEMYPPALKSPYCERRSAFGRERYGALGIAREDWEARQRAASANWDCFGAPAALFCYIDRDMDPPQWADVGMYLQTVMLLLRAEGLHSCPQMAWSVYHRTVAEILSPPEGLILFCGMSIGFEDVTVGHVRTGRAPLKETVTFVPSSTTVPRGVTPASPVRSGCRRPALSPAGRAPRGR
ncbi:nitroreductase [Sphaerisporangium sp. B11E5]|uniref:nitroreductase n=1 Tax=Sphaerisporangium sp. B11E5 TaxID=3153563 RepID=UPI00325DD023